MENVSAGQTFLASIQNLSLAIFKLSLNLTWSKNWPLVI